ncbi:MAG: hypothetical protein JO297_19465 [Nitrososphaeraceae archaeon]|nr:hypothetical protein [Nitrososphaeraceae archaeon]
MEIKIKKNNENPQHFMKEPEWDIILEENCRYGIIIGNGMKIPIRAHVYHNNNKQKVKAKAYLGTVSVDRDSPIVASFEGTSNQLLLTINSQFRNVDSVNYIGS